MNNMIKVGLLTVGLGLVMQPSEANAAVANHVSYSNAVNYCQAFTPGPSNTIRNRVIGSENIGSTIAVACNYASVFNGAASNTNLREVALFFSNGTTAAATVSCTLLTGTSPGISGGGTVYAVTKSVSVPASAANLIIFGPADNPTAGATDLGHVMVGVNCNLPTSVTLSLNRLQWNADNGI